MIASVRTVETSHGPARVHRFGRGRPGTLVLALGHGAGGGIDAPDLAAITRAVVDAGHVVVLVEQPWRVVGRRVAPRPAVLDDAWVQALRTIRRSGPLVVGGRSAGARVACRTAGPIAASGVLALAFPLHPPGRPDRSRVAELLACPAPVLVVQGDRDAFGAPDEIRSAARRARVVAVPGADHSLRRVDLAAASRRVVAWLDTRRE